MLPMHVRPVPPANSMLVMNGEGSTLWVPASTEQVQPWAPAHEVTGVELHGMEWARAWFGRMYFPSRSARLRESGSSHLSSHCTKLAGEIHSRHHASALSLPPRDNS